jgi:phage terminase large subunit
MPEVIVDYEPNDKQAIFHNSDAFEVVYGGAKGGGKSCALVMEAAVYGLEHAGANIYLFRETYDMLEATLIAEWKEKVPEQLYSYNEGKHIATLVNGSKVRFRYVKSKKDAELYQGRSFDFVGVDELTKHNEETIQELLSCVRSPKGFPPRFRATCNPGGIGHAWVKKRHIDGTDKGAKEIIDDKTGHSIAFIPARVYDNDVIMKNDPAYVKRLENLPEAKRKAFLYGDWDSFEGQAFSEWREDIHVVQPFKIPSTWKKYRGIDYGRTAPFCCLWAAEDQDHNIYIYREAYEAGLDATDQAKLINERTGGEDIYHTVLDSACWIPNQHGESIADTYESEGLYCDQASKNRLNGKDRVHKWLKVLKDHTGVDYSRLRVFKSCSNLIRTLPALPLDDKHIEDVDTKAEDHAYDALRYLLMSIAEPVDGVPHEQNAMTQGSRLSQDHLPHALRDDDDDGYGWHDL